MCKYCGTYHDYEYKAGGGRSREDLLMFSDAYTGIALQNTERYGFAIVAYGDFEAWYYPKYCPECGRRLLSDEEVAKKREQVKERSAH